jgi:hypothetical protein
MMQTTINDVLIRIKTKYNSNKLTTNKEIQLLKDYISKSDLFNGEKKKLYKLINKYKL